MAASDFFHLTTRGNGINSSGSSNSSKDTGVGSDSSDSHKGGSAAGGGRTLTWNLFRRGADKSHDRDRGELYAATNHNINHHNNNINVNSRSNTMKKSKLPEPIVCRNVTIHHR